MAHNTPHEQAARELFAEIGHTGDFKGKDLAAAIQALTTAHAAGFAEAREMAAKVSDSYAMEAAHYDLAEDAELIASISTAIRALTPPAAKDNT